MTSVSVDHAAAGRILHAAWRQIGDRSIVPPPSLAAKIESVIEAKDVTYKYILVTGLLARSVNDAVHPRALQTGSTLVNSYDARSLCHDVVVPFEKTKGDLWGLSNEPFVNKPARHPEHRKDNPQLRNAKGAEWVHDVLEYAAKRTPEEVFPLLIHCLRLGKHRADSQLRAQVQAKTTLDRVVAFVQRFLAESDGGTRLSAVTGAFVRLINHGFLVRVYPPNFSDRFARTAGDVEMSQDEQLLSAFECKHRPIKLDDIRHGITKARARRVAEYWFVIAAGYAAGQQTAIHREAATAKREIDVHLCGIRDVVDQWAALLNPVRRGEFGNAVVTILRDDMKRANVANEAAELWNSIE